MFCARSIGAWRLRRSFRTLRQPTHPPRNRRRLRIPARTNAQSEGIGQLGAKRRGQIQETLPQAPPSGGFPALAPSTPLASALTWPNSAASAGATPHPCSASPPSTATPDSIVAAATSTAENPSPATGSTLRQWPPSAGSLPPGLLRAPLDPQQAAQGRCHIWTRRPARHPPTRRPPLASRTAPRALGAAA